MSAAQANILIEAGATYIEAFTFLDDAGNPIDFAGATARMQVRTHVSDASPLLTLTTGSGITIDTGTGTITLRIEAAVTATLTPGHYDLLVTLGSGDAVRMLEGALAISPAVTR